VSEPAGDSPELQIAQRALAVCRRIDLPGAADAFARGAAAQAGLGIAFLYLYDGESDIDRLAASTLAPDDPWRREIAALDLSSLRTGERAGAGVAFIAPAPAGMRGLRVETVVAATLFEEGRPTGVLLLGEPDVTPTGVDLALLGRLVAAMLPGLLNARVVETYRDLVIKDDQSECFNRRFFDRSLSEELYRAQRYATTLSMVFLDLDNLKQVNEAYGHGAGSRTVREVARRLVVGIRGSDRAFRYGGDEFCIILPATPCEGARELCERLRLSIADKPFVVDSTTRVSVTASFGIAAYPEHARTSLGLIKCADDAMRQAKRAGKNVVHVARRERGENDSAASGGTR
jgi:diguanylate cyclase (GGDEF)-like protein